MPLLPHITDTDEQLHRMFSTFKNSGVKNIFPASITLFGDQSSDSKPLVLKAIQKYYPDLLEQYKTLFAYGFRPFPWYRNKLYKRTEALLQQYQIKNTLFDEVMTSSC